MPDCYVCECEKSAYSVAYRPPVLRIEVILYLFQARFHKESMAEYEKEVEETFPDKEKFTHQAKKELLKKYIAKIKEADGEKSCEVKQLFIPFTKQVKGMYCTHKHTTTNKRDLFVCLFV